MNNYNYIRSMRWGLPVLLLLAGSLCTGKKTTLANLLSDPASGLLQAKKSGVGTIIMQVLPGSTATREGTAGSHSYYQVKMALRSNNKIKGAAAMQYLNFGIRNSFYSIESGDTIPCSACERIPGINESEYLYMIFFNRPASPSGEARDLRLLVTDTIAGFGETVFLVKGEALKKLEAIK